MGGLRQGRVVMINGEFKCVVGRFALVGRWWKWKQIMQIWEYDSSTCGILQTLLEIFTIF